MHELRRHTQSGPLPCQHHPTPYRRTVVHSTELPSICKSERSRERFCPSTHTLSRLPPPTCYYEVFEVPVMLGQAQARLQACTCCSASIRPETLTRFADVCDTCLRHMSSCVQGFLFYYTASLSQKRIACGSAAAMSNVAPIRAAEACLRAPSAAGVALFLTIRVRLVDYACDYAGAGIHVCMYVCMYY